MTPSTRVPRHPRQTLLSFLALLALLLQGGPPALAEDEQAAAEATPALDIVAIEVEPPSPGPDTLCRLSVQVRNGGEQTASSLFFRVTINGEIVPVYENHVFMQAIPAGTTQTVRLYNFWSTETFRPMPADGRLRVEVTLREAKWMDISMEDDVEVWKPLGEVEALPVSRAATLEMQSG